MIDPWKFNPLSELGKEAGTLSTINYIKEVLSKENPILIKVKFFREQVKSGKAEIREKSDDLFL